MNATIKTSLAILIALGAGLVIGYLLFAGNGTMNSNGKKAASPVAHDHSNQSNSGAEESIEWTCSMHPQIRQNDSGSCPICGMDLIPFDKTGGNNPLVLSMTEEAVKLANIQTVIVGNASGRPEKIISLNGKIQLDERLSSSQTAHIAGRIEKLYINFTGEKVEAGQKLATIFSPALVSAQRELLEAVKLRDIDPKLLHAARMKLKFWKIPDQTIERIERTSIVEPEINIYADASGVVTKKNFSVGDHVMEGEVILEVMNLDNLWVVFDAYEEDLQFIKMGSRIEFTTPAMPNRKFRTSVSFIDPLVNPTTRTTAVRGEVSNTRGLLKPDMFVKGNLRSFTSSTDQIIIPRSSVMWTGKRSVVYIKVPDEEIPSYEFREIDLGERMGDGYAVKSGLEPGEEIVVNGAFTIDAAAQLNNQRSMMNKKVKIKDDTADLIPDFTSDIPEKFKKQLGELVNAYLVLKDGLVATDKQSASAAAKIFVDKTDEVDMSLLKNDAHLYWMDKLSGITGHGTKIYQSSDVEEQRNQFIFLSENLIHSVRAFGIKGDEYYLQHCPMANDNTGADWLSDNSQIANPYFGSKMLRCGSVTDTIN